MQIQGEAYAFMNGWMNYLSLLIACRLIRMPFPFFRGLLAAAAGTAYAFFAAAAGPAFQGIGALLVMALIMCMIAGGKKCMALLPMVFAGGLMLSGLMEFVMDKGMAPVPALGLSGVCGLILAWGMEGMIPKGGGKFRLQIRYRGKKIRLPAIRDSGNLMRDPVTGLSVIVIPSRLLPENGDFLRPGGLKKGQRLLSLRTAAGNRLVVCLHPEEIIIIRGRKKWRVDALIALSDFHAPGALLPGSLFMQKEDGMNAGL